MIRVLFVCHGNICRSPMAEYIFREMVMREGLSAEFEIASAATSSEEVYCGVGNPVYPPVKALLKKRGIDCSQKRAHQMNESDYESYDYIIAMDNRNIANLNRMFHQDPSHKIKRILSDKEVSDPWYHGDFDLTFQEIEQGCMLLLEEFKRILEK